MYKFCVLIVIIYQFVYLLKIFEKNISIDKKILEIFTNLGILIIFIKTMRKFAQIILKKILIMIEYNYKLIFFV